MEKYHYTDKQTFSNIHFKLNIPVFTLYDNRLEFETKFIPKKSDDTIHTVLLECILVDAFNQTHSSGIADVRLESEKMHKICIDIPFEKKILLSKSTVRFVFVSSNGEKQIVSYYIAQTKTVSLVQVERIGVSEEEMDKYFMLSVEESVETKENEDDIKSLEKNGNQLPHQLIEYVNALHKEVFFLKQRGGRQYKVVNGEKLKTAKEGYYYIFELEDEIFLADDAPISVMVNAEKEASGSVLLCEDFQILFVVDKDLGDKVHVAFIRVEPWKLLVAQADRIAKINSREHAIATKLIEEGPALATKQSIETIDKGQPIAKVHVNRDDITVVWGPPGTGKTYTMAEIALDYIQQNKKVLIVSHSNVSVDGVINKVVGMLLEQKKGNLLSSGAIMRYGYVRDPELSTNEFATSFNYALSHCQGLQRELDLLLEEKEEYKAGRYKDRSKIVDIEKQIKSIRNKIHAEEKRYVAGAKLVGTTISKVTVDSVFEERQYDVVMFDEVSMAYVTQIICAATLARNKFICVGDFKQLPPISQDTVAKKVLNTDIFGYLGIIDSLGNMFNHPWLVMLNEQRRMHPDIANFVNRRIYKSLLENHPDTYTQRDEIVNVEPLKGHAMNMIDLHGTYCAASKNSANSRYNILSAILSFATVLTAEKNLPLHKKTGKKSAGIITPYAAQSKLIRAMINDEKSKKKTDMVCATVHQFQGSESDLIVFDAVESYPTAMAGFLMSKEMRTVQRLINVAVTRARGKFVTVANGKFWIKEFANKKNHTYYQLVTDLQNKHNAISVKESRLQEYIRGLDAGKNIALYLEQKNCISQFINDLNNAKQRIIVSIPDGRLDEAASTILKELQYASRRGIDVFIKSKDFETLPHEWRVDCIKSDNAVFPMISIDDKIIWYGLPVGKGGFKVKEWTFLTVCPLIARLKGENTVDLLMSLTELEMIEEGKKKIPLEIKQIVDEKISGNKSDLGFAKFLSQKQFCPECKSHLIMAKGRTGKFYLKCSKSGCSHSEFITVDMINHYINIYDVTCPVDHGELQGRLGQYGVYIHCDCGHNLKLDQI